MDDVRFHHCLDVKSLIEEAGHTLLFLPPYSPFLNPIENLFHKWKTIVRHVNPKDHDALISSMQHAPNRITPQEIGNYFSHFLKYFPDCIKMKHINN